MKKERITLSNDIQIAYQWVEPEIQENKSTIVFLHEAIGSIGQWKQFPQILCNRLRARGLIYERQGYGDSSPLTAKRTTSYLEDYALQEMPQVMEQLLPNESLFLVGHSDGGTIALLYASAFPERIENVVSLAPHVLVEQKTMDGFQPILSMYQEGKFAGLRKYHGDRMDEVFHAWCDTWNLPEYRDWNVLDKIHQDIPTLVIQGDLDEYATAQHPVWIQEKLEKCTVEILKNCHHQPQLEMPEKVVDVIEEWILIFDL